MVIRKLEPSDEAAFFAAVAAWPKDVGFDFALGYEAGVSISDYLKILDERDRGQNLPEGFVPMTLLFGFIDDMIVGRVSFRHRLNEGLLKSGGHIGYGVMPGYRGKGIATALLRAILPVAQARGLKKVLLTCDDDNLASIKTIEKCGGVLENIIGKERRYWIDL